MDIFDLNRELVKLYDIDDMEVGDVGLFGLIEDENTDDSTWYGMLCQIALSETLCIVDLENGEIYDDIYNYPLYEIYGKDHEKVVCID